MRMPFGKYRGVELRNIPSAYLHWVYDNANNAGPTLLAAIADELGIVAGDVDPSVSKVWLRTMAKRHHPDRGGDTRSMQIVNEGYELLEFLVSGEKP